MAHQFHRKGMPLPKDNPEEIVAMIFKSGAPKLAEDLMQFHGLNEFHFHTLVWDGLDFDHLRSLVLKMDKHVSLNESQRR